MHIYPFSPLAPFFISGTTRKLNPLERYAGKDKRKAKDQKLQERQELQGCLQAQVWKGKGPVSVAQRAAARERKPRAFEFLKGKKANA